VVTLDTDTPPAVGNLIIATEGGMWTIAEGLDASIITRGTISQDRLPTQGGGVVNFPYHVATSASSTWTNMPQAEDELLGTPSKRLMLDTSLYTQMWMTMRVQGSSNSANTPICYPRFSLNDSTWTTVTGISISLSTSGTKGAASGYVPIPEAAKTTTTIWAVWCSGGDGAADPAFGSGSFYFK
jgi:hypothetical protein